MGRTLRQLRRSCRIRKEVEACGTGAAIELVRKQVRELYREGFEIALHLHPQWCNACYRDGRWLLDFNEYNLCTLPENRIATIVEDSLDYLRHIIDEPSFTPLSFRSGNWLFQPTQPAASVLARNGIKVDSSVFKGGLQHKYGLDYRAALKNGYYWSFVSRCEPTRCGRRMHRSSHLYRDGSNLADGNFVRLGFWQDFRHCGLRNAMEN